MGLAHITRNTETAAKVPKTFVASYWARTYQTEHPLWLIGTYLQPSYPIHITHCTRQPETAVKVLETFVAGYLGENTSNWASVVVNAATWSYSKDNSRRGWSRQGSRLLSFAVYLRFQPALQCSCTDLNETLGRVGMSWNVYCEQVNRSWSQRC